MLICKGKTNLRLMVILFFLFYVLMALTSCNPLAGDNKATSIDSAPKPQLAAMTLRTDVPPVFTNNFSGVVQFLEKSLFDTLLYNMYVYKNYIRIDKFRKKDNFESLIINLTENNIYILNHSKHLYSEIKAVEEKANFDSTFKIIKTGNEKNILGKKCKQWRVKNVKENTEVTYWVDSSNYGFFYYLIKVWNSTSKPNKYFQLISNSFNCMPLEIVERNLLRDIKSSINVTKIEYATVDTNTFKVPYNYTLFSN